MIPTDGSALIEPLHPIFKRRLAAALRDPRLEQRVVVVSGARTYDEQKYLYDGYKARLPGFNLASNPDRILGAREFFGQKFTAKGSWHMVQDTGYAYAVDVNYRALPREIRLRLERVMREYGLHRTVPTERWHYQPIPTVVTRWDYPDTQEDDDMRRFIRLEGQTQQWLTDGIWKLPISSSAQRQDYIDMGVPDKIHEVDAATFGGLIDVRKVKLDTD